MAVSKLCVISSNLKNDESFKQALNKFNLPVTFHDDLLTIEDGEQSVFVIDEFEGELYDAIHRKAWRVLGPTAVKQLSDQTAKLPPQMRPLYCTSMAGIVLCFTGFRRSDIVARYATIIHHMGGSIRKEFSANITHVIAKTTRGDKYRYAADMGLSILSEEWLENAWANRHDPNFRATDDLDKFRLPPFFLCRLALIGFQVEDENHMKDMAVKNGATLTEVSDPECTHVIVETDCTAPTELQGKPFIVKSDWFWASIRVDSCAEEQIYLHNQTKEMDKLSAVLSPTNRSTNRRLSRGYKRKRELKETVAQLAKEGEQLDTSRRASLDLRNNQSCGSIGSVLDASTLLSPDAKELSPNVIPLPESKPLTKRHQICRELIQTESNYVQILRTIMQIKEELEEPQQVGGQLLDSTEVKIIFGNIPPIYEVHCNLLRDLEKLVESWTEQNQIGEVLLKHSQDLIKAYPPFVNFFEKTKDSLNHCDMTKPRFHAFLKLWQSKKECGRQSLRELFIRPVQRLPSVILLLNDILKHTVRSNPDHDLLEHAIGSIKDVVRLINECKRKTEGQVAMFSLFNDVENCPPNLVSSHRSLIKQVDLLILNDALGRKGEHLTVFLFSDILEICKKRQRSMASGNAGGAGAMRSPSTVSLQSLAPSKQKCYKHLEMMPLSHIKRVVNINETEDVKNVFALICRSNEELKERLYTFAFVDKDANKLQFLGMLCRHIANTVCRNDAESFLTDQDPQNLNINTSDISTKTIAKLLGGIASKSKDKLCRALSLKRNNTLTPQMMKNSTSSSFSGRRFTRAVSSIISPMRAAVTPTGGATLPRKFNQSTTNLEASSPGASPIQATKKRKYQTLSSFSRRIL